MGKHLVAQGSADIIEVGQSTPAAIKLLGGIVEREALVLSFNDIMLLIGGLFLIGLIMIPILKRPGASPLSH